MTFLLIICMGLGLSLSSYGKELSLISGFYRTTSQDTGNDSSELSLGARYGLPIGDNQQWYIQAQIAKTSFKGDNPPDDQSVFQVGGGKRYYFKRFTPRLIPYLSWLALLSSSDQGSNQKQFGIFYSGQFGIRMPLSSQFFVNLECNLFTSALTSTEETDDGNGGSDKNKRTELFIDSVGGFNDTVVSVGYRLQ